MDVLFERCCGLDIHKKTITACVLTPGERGKPRKEVRRFETTVAHLLALGDWMAEEGVTHVAMESTGVYWKPVYNLLEERFTLLLANAHHIKAVPGRKTDVRDCEWIANLLRHGLIRGSFVPPRPQRELRELTRYRTSLVRERAAEVNRLQKSLEGANIKLASVVTDILGKSGREMLEALIAGSTDAAAMAQLARKRMRQKLPELEKALSGTVGPHQRFLFAQQLKHIDFLNEAIDQVSLEIEERLRPFEECLQRLDGIPGIAQRAAECLVAEIGTDVAPFPSPGHLASWAGMCPGNNESAGKRRSGRTRKANPWVRTTLVEAANAAIRKRNTYLAAQYHRLVVRLGHKKAVMAVAHSILVIVYHMLQRGSSYQDLGYLYFDQLNRQSAERRLTRNLERLGYKVMLQPAA